MDRKGGGTWNMEASLMGKQFDWTRAMRNWVRVGSAYVRETPDDVASARITVRTTRGTLAYVDDVRFEEVTPGFRAPMPVYAGNVETRTGSERR